MQPSASTHQTWIGWDPGWCWLKISPSNINSGSHSQGAIKVLGGPTWNGRMFKVSITSSSQLSPSFSALIIYSLVLYLIISRGLRMLVLAALFPYKITKKSTLEENQNWGFVKLHYWQRRLGSLLALRWRYVPYDWDTHKRPQNGYRGSSWGEPKLISIRLGPGWSNNKRHRRCDSRFYHQSFSLPISSTIFWLSSIMLYQVCNCASNNLECIRHPSTCISVNNIIAHGIPDEFVRLFFFSAFFFFITSCPID